MILEKDKEIKLLHIKLREFLQRNMKELPIKSFDEIENIIGEPRKMADTYKRVREIAHKKAGSEQEMDQIISKFLSSKRSVSTNRHR